jgi:hypothetical protein
MSVGIVEAPILIGILFYLAIYLILAGFSILVQWKWGIIASLLVAALEVAVIFLQWRIWPPYLPGKMQEYYGNLVYEVRLEGPLQFVSFGVVVSFLWWIGRHLLRRR